MHQQKTELVTMKHPDSEDESTAPRWAFEAHWSRKGWREFDPADPEKEFPVPAGATAQDDAPDDENVGADQVDAVPPESAPVKGGTPKDRAASAADKE